MGKMGLGNMGNLPLFVVAPFWQFLTIPHFPPFPPISPNRPIPPWLVGSFGCGLRPTHATFVLCSNRREGCQSRLAKAHQ